MKPIQPDDRLPSAAEPTDAARSRLALSDASYYRARAEEHRRMGGRATPAIYAVHRELSAAYGAAATAIERGESVDFAGDHRAERPTSRVIEEPALAQPADAE